MSEICECGSQYCKICNQSVKETLPDIYFRKLGSPVRCDDCGGYNPPGRECGWCKQEILPGFEKFFQKP